MARFVSSITKTGPLFTADIDKTLGENFRTLMEAIAREGEADVRGQSPGGKFSEGIHGRVESLHGKRWYRNAIVSQTYIYPWSVPHGQRGFKGRDEAQYRGGKLEGRRHMFRRTASRLRSARAINQAELAKGLT